MNNRKQTRGRRFKRVYNKLAEKMKWIRLQTSGDHRYAFEKKANDNKNKLAGAKPYVSMINGDVYTAIHTTKSKYTRERLNLQ